MKKVRNIEITEFYNIEPVLSFLKEKTNCDYSYSTYNNSFITVFKNNDSFVVDHTEDEIIEEFKRLYNEYGILVDVEVSYENIGVFIEAILGRTIYGDLARIAHEEL